MLKDRYDNDVTAASAKARDLYVEAVDGLLSAAPRMHERFEAVLQEDPSFALGHTGLARCRQIVGDVAGARAAMAGARAFTSGVSAREASHIHAMGLLIDGQVSDGYRAVRAHVAQYPRDAALAQTCTSVFGLIGFSGQPGRESELLSYTASLLPHYGDDWWMLSQHAFSLCETGQIAQAEKMIDHSLALNPSSGHSAHVRAHVHYEAGESADGIRFVEQWLPGYDRGALMHGHISWHTALWKLETGDVAGMWQLVDENIAPDVSHSPPLNVLTDNAAILYRAELAGEVVPAARWLKMSDYAAQYFPKPGLGFADVHAALSYAMAGTNEALDEIISSPAGPAADVVKTTSEAFRAISRQDWPEAAAQLTLAMGDHARLGGSRAQRDLLEHAMLGALLKLGKADEARRMLAMRRPVQAHNRPVVGL